MQQDANSVKPPLSTTCRDIQIARITKKDSESEVIDVTGGPGEN
jgi:hypothetical protein